MSAARLLRSRLLGLIVITLGLAILIPAVANTYWTSVAISTVIFTIAALGLVTLYGQIGYASLAQVALIGVGGWLMLRLNYATELPFIPLLIGAGLGTGAVALLLGIPALRIGGLYFALLTLMAAAAAEVFFRGAGFPNGGGGFLGSASVAAGKPLARPEFAESGGAYLRFALIVAAIMFAVVALHLRRRPGRAWAAIRQREATALSLGVETARFKLWGFALSGFLAGIAGGLLAGSVGTLDVAGFSASESVVLFVTVLVAGPFVLAGAVIAGVLAKVVPAILEQIGVNANFALVFFGVAVLQTLIQFPSGLAGLPRRVLERRSALKAERPDGEPASEVAIDKP